MFRDVIPAIVTPMQADGAVDHGALAAQVERQLAHGAGGVFCAGTNGEFYVLTDDEKTAVTETCARAAGGRAVMAGTPFAAPADIARLAARCRDAGAAAISALVPYFVDCAQDGIAAHLEAVADLSPLPVVVYNIPGRTRNDLERETAARLARHPNIAGIKDSSGRRETVAAFARIEGLQTMTGSDGLILHGLELGLVAFVSGFANVAPEWVHAIPRLFREGRREEAAEMQARVEALRAMLSLGNPGTVTKRAAALRGQAVGPSRAPCAAGGEAMDRALREIMAGAGLDLADAAE